MSDEIEYEVERLRQELTDAAQQIVASNLTVAAVKMSSGKPTTASHRNAYEAYEKILELIRDKSK